VQDELVNIDNARQIFDAAKHPKSFVSLDSADHLLTRPADAAYAATVLAAWTSRFLSTVEPRAVPGQDSTDAMIGCVYTLLGENFDDLFAQLAHTRLGASQPGGLFVPQPHQVAMPAGPAAMDPRAQLSAATRTFARRATQRRLRRL
jgi:hypothetical protein